MRSGWKKKPYVHLLIPRMDEEGGEEEEGCLGAPSAMSFWNPEPCMLWPPTEKVAQPLLVQSCCPDITAHWDTAQGSSLESHLPFQKNIGAYRLWSQVQLHLADPSCLPYPSARTEKSRRLMLLDFTTLHINMNSHKTQFTFRCQAGKSGRFKVQ